MAFDSQTIVPASSMTGTMPTGLSALNAGSEVERNAAAPVFALERKAELFAGPEDFADVDGGGVAVDFEHEGSRGGDRRRGRRDSGSKRDAEGHWSGVMGVHDAKGCGFNAQVAAG